MRVSTLLLLILSVQAPGLLADAAQDYRDGARAYHEEDLIGAMSLLERASSQGYTRAKVLLAYILDKANEHEQAASLYREAAETGDAAAELGLAQLRAIGQGVEKDSLRALQLLKSSADKGHVPAMLMLAEAYRAGELGLSKDQETATGWLRKAADEGSEEARAQLKRIGE